MLRAIFAEGNYANNLVVGKFETVDEIADAAINAIRAIDKRAAELVNANREHVARKLTETGKLRLANIHLRAR